MKKLCSNCGESRPRSEFYKMTRSADGLQAWCKECKKKHEREQNYVRVPAGRMAQIR